MRRSFVARFAPFARRPGEKQSRSCSLPALSPGSWVCGAFLCSVSLSGWFTGNPKESCHFQGPPALTHIQFAAGMRKCSIMFRALVLVHFVMLHQPPCSVRRSQKKRTCSCCENVLVRCFKQWGEKGVRCGQLGGVTYVTPKESAKQ